MEYDYDEKDVAIIRTLVSNARLSCREIAKRLKLHPNTVIERMGRMEEAGVIERYSAMISHEKLGYGVTAMVQVDVEGKTDDALKKIAKVPYVHETYRTTGEYDGIALIRCRDMNDLGKATNDINEIHGVQRVNTKIVLGSYPGTCEFATEPATSFKKL